MSDERQVRRPEFPGLAVAEAAAQSLQLLHSAGDLTSGGISAVEVERTIRCVRSRQPKLTLYADGQQTLASHSWIAGPPCKSRLCPLCARSDQMRIFGKLRSSLKSTVLEFLPHASVIQVDIETDAGSGEQLATAVSRQLECWPRLLERRGRKIRPEKGVFRRTLVSRKTAGSFVCRTTLLVIVADQPEGYAQQIVKELESELSGSSIAAFQALVPSRDQFASDTIPANFLNNLLSLSMCGLEHESFCQTAHGQLYYDPADLLAVHKALRKRHLISFTGILNSRIRECTEIAAKSKPRVYVPS